MALTTVLINKLKSKFLAKLNYIYPLGVGWPMQGVSAGVLMLNANLGVELS